MELDQILDLGSYCDNLISDPHFQFLCAEYEQGLVTQMISTKPHEQKLREHLYSKIIAHREFLTMVAEHVKEKNDALKQQNPQDQQDDLIDDPGVHDIYR